MISSNTKTSNTFNRITKTSKTKTSKTITSNDYNIERQMHRIHEKYIQYIYYRYLWTAINEATWNNYSILLLELYRETTACNRKSNSRYFFFFAGGSNPVVYWASLTRVILSSFLKASIIFQTEGCDEPINLRRPLCHPSKLLFVRGNSSNTFAYWFHILISTRGKST